MFLHESNIYLLICFCILFQELNALKPHKDFRLWLTSEVHPKFPTILLQSSIKITYEAPPGIKKNLLRTFEIWTQDEFGKGSTTRSQILFALAWFHAIVQERRKYIPQVLYLLFFCLQENQQNAI